MTAMTARSTSTLPALAGEQLTAVIRDDPEALAAFREAMKAVNQHDLPGDNVTGQRIPTGNSRAYSIDRVKRECDPETVAAVMAGQVSPNAALVRAGVRENRQVYIPRDPAGAVAKLRLQVPEWYRPGHWHAGGHHPSAWLFYVWPHPAGDPWVHAVTLEPVRRGTPVPEAIAKGYDIDRTAAGPKRGIRIDAVTLILGMQAVNGMPPLSDPGWTIGAARLWSEERIAKEPSYNQFLFFSDDDYRRNGLGITTPRQGASA